MIGPSKKKMADRLICSNCEDLISHTVGGGNSHFPERVVHYCNYDKPSVRFIKKFPYTPEWCPALKEDQEATQ